MHAFTSVLLICAAILAVLAVPLLFLALPYGIGCCSASVLFACLTVSGLVAGEEEASLYGDEMTS